MVTLKVTYTDNSMNSSYMATLRETERQKGRTIMIDEIYNSRIGAIKTYHFSDEWEKTAIPFEESLSEEQTILFHKLCDLQSETAANEMRAAYKAGFKDGIVLITE